MKLRLSNGKMSVGLCLRYIKRYRNVYDIEYKYNHEYYEPEEFVVLHNDINKHICYCEVLINSSGFITYATPSHDRAVFNNEIERALYEYKVGVEGYSMGGICDDFNVIMVWYDEVIIGTKIPTKEQVAAMYTLMLNGCISGDCWHSFIDKISTLKYHEEEVRYQS